MTGRPVKCVVWDLDGTVWNGVLMEDVSVAVDPDIAPLMRALDERGILNSIASRNDPKLALAKLDELGLRELIVSPQIGWGTKSESVGRLSQRLGIATDSMVLVDDDAFERDQVASEHTDVRCFSPNDLPKLFDRREFNPAVITDEARRRRAMYQAAEQRDRDEETHVGPRQEFLASLGLVCEITSAEEADLHRAEELTVRTNQLNTTGVLYSADELRTLITSPEHSVLVARMHDRYGEYGTVGLAIVERRVNTWTLPLMLMSCRVLSRGAGTIMLGYVMRQAATASVKLRVPVVDTGRNRQMIVTLRFAGFRPTSEVDGHTNYDHDLQDVPVVPDWVELSASASIAGGEGRTD